MANKNYSTETSPRSSLRKQYRRPPKLPIDLISLFSRVEDLTPDQRKKRVTIWHRIDQRKIAGSAAPLRKNLEKYLKGHLECDIFVGQDSWDILRPGGINGSTSCSISEDVCRVDIWNRVTMCKITGGASPLRKNLLAFLARNPNCEVYRNQDRRRRKPLYGVAPVTQGRKRLPRGIFRTRLPTMNLQKREVLK